MTISNYYVCEYLRLYREYRKALNLSDLFLLYGKIEYTLGELRRDFSLFILGFGVPWLIFFLFWNDDDD